MNDNKIKDLPIKNQYFAENLLEMQDSVFRTVFATNHFEKEVDGWHAAPVQLCMFGSTVQIRANLV